MTAPTYTDPRTEGWLDPSLPFASTPTNWVTQINDTWTNSRSVRTVPEPGILGESGIYTLQRITDPRDPSGYVYLHRIKPGWPTWQGTNRSSIAQANKVGPSAAYPGGITLQAGNDYWIGFAFEPQSDCRTGATSFSVFDIHQDNWTPDPDSVGVRAPLQVMVHPTGQYIFDLWGCLTPGYNLSQVVNNNTTYSWAPGERHYWVLKVRLVTSWSQGPYIQAWRAVDNGPLTLQVSRTDFPLGYTDVYGPAYYVKPGLYYWYTLDAQRTIYSKGCYVMSATAGTTTIDEAAMLEIMRAGTSASTGVPFAAAKVPWAALSGNSNVAWAGPITSLVTSVSRDYDVSFNAGGTIERDYSPTYALEGAAVEKDLSPTYDIADTVERDFSVSWNGSWTRITRDTQVWTPVSN